MEALEIKFHGVRGSLAAPGADTAGVGGNTSCVEITAGDERIVLDAGTGLRGLGERLAAGPASKTTVLLSHVHWDHIQGLPFFVPIYIPGHEIDVISGPNGVMPLDAALRRQMSPPFFPVAFDEVPSRLTARDARAGVPWEVGDAVVHMARLNHPDPVYGYRIEWGGRSVVYATDTEHYSCVDPTLLKLAQGADVLIYDAQYTPEEYRGDVGPPKVGWGHSTFEAAIELSRRAGVGELVLFHHDPRRSDAGVADIERRARATFPGAVAAREGASIALPAYGSIEVPGSNAAAAYGSNAAATREAA
jgi:phosphoribosyl 1,2-cyclic phosphodiesterase